MAKARTKTALEKAVGALGSEAWREHLAAASAKELEGSLAGVSWAAPFAYAPGSFVPGAGFASRGADPQRVQTRVAEIVAQAPVGCRVAAKLRREVESLGLVGTEDAAFSVAPFAALPRLRWLRVTRAGAVSDLDALGSLARLELFDVARLEGDLGTADELSIHPVRTSAQVGPLRGSARRLVVSSSPALGTLRIGAFPRVEKIEILGCPRLDTLELEAPLPSLRELVLTDVGLRAIPALPTTLEHVRVWAPDLDVSALAKLPTLRRLELRGALRKLEKLAASTKLEALVLEPSTKRPPGVATSLEGLEKVLPRLKGLRELSLAGHHLERVPPLDRLAPQLEVLSLHGCDGSMEHDVLARMPHLRLLRLTGSTLASYPKQIDPKLKRPGLRIELR